MTIRSERNTKLAAMVDKAVGPNWTRQGREALTELAPIHLIALLKDNERLEEALADALNYIEAVVANSGDTNRRANYRAAAERIKSVLEDLP